MHIHSQLSVSSVHSAPVAAADSTASDSQGKDKQAAGRDESAQASENERRQLQQMKARDLEVRAHESAHAAAAGSLAKGGASFEYQRGPDGRLYAVGGEVQIDTSPVAGDPEATLQKAQQIRQAALAPADPSAQDRAVAAQATIMAVEARADMVEARNAESGEGAGLGLGAGESADTGESVETKPDLEQANTLCATCGGKHSAEAHTGAVAYQYVDPLNNTAGQLIKATA